MAVTNVIPASGAWNTDFRNFLFDAARSKYVDVATKQDANNVPDRVDVATGNADAQSKDATGGLLQSLKHPTKKGMLELGAIGVGLIVLAVMLKKVVG